ncbi:MAG: hypothetical protein WC059_00305 [Candidatus Paceibacterota bacterium]
MKKILIFLMVSIVTTSIFGQRGQYPVPSVTPDTLQPAAPKRDYVGEANKYTDEAIKTAIWETKKSLMESNKRVLQSLKDSMAKANKANMAVMEDIGKLRIQTADEVSGIEYRMSGKIKNVAKDVQNTQKSITTLDKSLNTTKKDFAKKDSLTRVALAKQSNKTDSAFNAINAITKMQNGIQESITNQGERMNSWGLGLTLGMIAIVLLGLGVWRRVGAHLPQKG